MAKVLIAYNRHKDKARWDKFKQDMSQRLCSINSEAFRTTKGEITFVSEQGRLTPEKVGAFDLVICAEEVDSLKIGVGTIKKWKAVNPDIRIILIVDKEKKSSGKLNAMYELGFYDALLGNDFKWTKIERLILVPRTEKDAYDYYGLMYFTDYSKLKKKEDDRPIGELVADYKKDVVREQEQKATDERFEKIRQGEIDAKVRKSTENAPSGSAKKDSKDAKVAQKEVKTPEKNEVTKRGANKKSKDERPVHEDFDRTESPSRANIERNRANVQQNIKSKAENEESVKKAEDTKDNAVTQKGTKSEQKGNGNNEQKNVKAELEDDFSKKDKGNSPENEKKAKSTNSKDDVSQKDIVVEDAEETTSGEVTGNEIDDATAEAEKLQEYLRHESLSQYLERVDYLYEDEGDDDDELIDEMETESTDVSEYLIPVTEDDYFKGEVDWQEESEDNIKKFIKCMENKAFNPIILEPELDREGEVLEEILDYYTSVDTVWIANLENGVLNQNQFSQHLWEKVQTYTDLSPESMNYVYDSFCNYMWNYDILTPLINDPSISDIALVAYNNIQVKKNGMRYFSTITFRTPSHFTNFINHIVRLNHVDLSDKRPNKTFMDTSTSASARMRFVYSKEYINAVGEPSLVIRKVPTKKFSIADLVDKKMMDYSTAGYILDAVLSGKSIIWTGTMASGKTSQMNTYLDFIPQNMRGLFAQENEELFSTTHPLLQFQDIRPSEDGDVLYDLRYLLRFALLMDFNYIGIGEIKGGEAEQFAEAVYTNCICWASVHSTGAKEALPRIATLAVTDQYTYTEQLRKLAQGIDLVIYLEDFVVREVTEVIGWDNTSESIIYKDVKINIPKKINAKKSRSELRDEKKKSIKPKKAS